MSTPETAKRRVSQKAGRFTESVIRAMTREALKHGAVNLSQGFPDFPAPEEIKRAAAEAIAADVNQYAITWGAKDFREAVSEKTRWYLGLDVDPEREITVTCGSTEGMIAAMMATVDPGEEGVLFEPFYENYAPEALLGHRRESRLRDSAARHHERRAQSPRLPHRRRRRALAERRGLRPAPAAPLLRAAPTRLRAPPRHARARARRCGLPVFQSRR